MPQSSPRASLWIGVSLATLMLATRGQHVLSLTQPLPDASLAIFFLAGFYLRGTWVLVVLLAEAVLIDVAAVTWGGVSSFCISPAYLLLIPAYGLLWGVGHWNGERFALGVGGLGALGSSLLAATLGAELLASGGFYLFSGRFADPSLSELWLRLMDYFPMTLGALVLYLGLAGLVSWVLAHAQMEPHSTAH